MQTALTALPNGGGGGGGDAQPNKKPKLGRGEQKTTLLAEAAKEDVFSLNDPSSSQVAWLGRTLHSFRASLVQKLLPVFAEAWRTTGKLPTEEEVLMMMMEHGLAASDVFSQSGYERFTRADLANALNVLRWVQISLPMLSGVPNVKSTLATNVLHFMSDGLLSNNISFTIKNIVTDTYLGAPASLLSRKHVQCCGWRA